MNNKIYQFFYRVGEIGLLPFRIIFKKRRKKFSSRILIISLFILIIFGPLVYFITRKPKSAEAGWWNDIWHYRKSIAITSGSAALTDFQVRISDYDTASDIAAGKMQSDCGDIRFTSADGVELPYWIEDDTCDTSTTQIWVKIDNIPATGGTTIYMYYGNPSAEDTSDGDNVFEFFDDFNGDSLDTTKWPTLTTSGSPTCEQTSGYFRMYRPSASQTCRLQTNNILSFSDYRIVEFSHKIVGTYVYYESVYYYDSSNYSSICYSNYTNYEAALFTGAGSYAGRCSSSASTEGDIITDPPVNSWFREKFTIPNSSNKISRYLNDTTLETSTNYNGLNSGGSIGIFSASTAAFANDQQTDWILVRKYDSTGSTAGSPGSEEKGTSPLAYWAFDENYGTVAYDSQGNHDGTINNSPAWVDGARPNPNQKNLGSALDFTAASNHTVSVGDLNTTINAISFWLYSESDSNNLFDFDSGTHSISSSSNILGAFGFTDPTIYINGKQGTTITLNQWQHIVITTATGFSASNFIIGQATRGPTGYFEGKLDEVKLYDFVLSSSQIKKEYNRSAAAVLGAGQKPNPGNNPIAYYKLDEGSGSNAYDSSGSENHASIGTGASAPSWTIGKIGKALDFDGLNDLVDFSPFDGSGIASGTLEAWVKTTYYDEANSLRIVEIGTTTDRVGLMINTTGQATLYSIDSSSVEINISSTTSIDDGNWHHITGTWNSSGAYLYIDGIQVNTVSGDKTNALSGTSTGYIGEYIGGGAYYWSGQIDHIKIYNYARTLDQIHQDIGGSPIGYWRFDEGYGSTVYDEMKNNNGSLGVGGSAPSWADGAQPNENQKPLGKALNFDGTDDSVSVANDDSLDTLGDYTISFWVYNEAGSKTYPTILNRDTQSASDGYFWIYTTGTNEADVNFQYSNGAAAQTKTFTGALPLNTWAHFVFTYTDSDEALKLYVDGIQFGAAQTLTNCLPVDDGIFYLGVYNGLSTSYPFDGKLDEFKLYDYALTADEVSVEYNRGSAVVLGAGLSDSDPGSTNLKAWWKMDEGSGTTLYDSSGIGNSGAMQNMEVSDWVSGKVGKALDFDGTNDYVSIANESNFDFGTNSFSITGWFKHNTISQTEYLTTKICQGLCVNGGYGIYMISGGELRFGIDDDNTSFPEDYAGGGDYDDNNWHFFSAVKSSTSSVKLYVDGIFINEDTSLSAINTLNNDYYFLIGDVSGTGNSWTGQIDNVKVWNTALTQAQINWEYNLGKPAAHWRFDEKDGTTLYDESDNNNDAEMQNTPTRTTGKFNNAVDFEADSSQYAYLEDNTSLSFTADFTASAWIKPESNTADTIFPVLAKWDSNTDDPPKTFYDFMFAMYGDELVLYLDSAGNYKITNTANLQTGVWHHVAAVYQANAQTVTLYVNGKEFSGTVNGSIPSSITDNDGRIHLGATDSSGFLDSLFDGIIDEAKIYNYALTQDQIKADYNNSAAVRFN